MTKKFRTNYDYKESPGISFPERGRTKQEFKAECNINTIMKKFEKTGQLPDMIKANPQYGDFSNVGTYQESLQVVMFAQEQFEALPAAARKRFKNDPQAFLAFCQDPSNQEEMIKMGLATRKDDTSSVSNEAPAPSPAPSPKGAPKKAPKGSPPADSDE